MRRGAYPGSFNPPTVAHLAIADAARRRLGLDRVDLIISRDALGKHPDGLVPVEPPELSEGNHFSYALQWFAFAGIAAFGLVVLVRSDLRDRRRAEAEAAPAMPAGQPAADSTVTAPAAQSGQAAARIEAVRAEALRLEAARRAPDVEH